MTCLHKVYPKLNFMNPITFYDIPSTVPGKCWSVNLWKTRSADRFHDAIATLNKSSVRYSLGFKRLPFRTEWVEYPDIAPMSKKLGFLPTAMQGDSPYYSLPAIYDPNTSTSLSDSALIAEYLDKAYPDTPKLFPPGSHALQYAFIDALGSKLEPIWAFALPASHKILNPQSQDYFRRTREAHFGKPLEDVTPKGEAAVEEWTKVKAAFDAVYGWLEKGKANGPYFLGPEPAFVDIVVASYLLYFKKIWGVDSQQWRDFSTWNNGRWGMLVKDFEKYEIVQ
ncbi:hypothetical protein C0992_009756 [Termitomyces sp. T32_za158]|nr:hypothetical protein C0992_009756 [Termitomyces sp. T32_za158]